MRLIFQYGSNCNADRLRARLGDIEDLGRAQTVDEYDITFNVWSQGNGCAASNLMPAPRCHAWGILYEVPADRICGRKRPDGKKTLEEIEGSRYEPKTIRVRKETGEEVEATTLLVKPDEHRQGLWTKADYVRHIVNGLRSHQVPEAYAQHVIHTALATNQKPTDCPAQESRNIESLRHTNH